MSNPPFLYDYVNLRTTAINPSTIHVSNTPLSIYFQKYLVQKAMGRFRFRLPDAWAENYFSYVLFCFGYITVIKTDKYGVIPQDCTLQGYNVFYQPSKVLVANPLLYTPEPLTIGKECELIYLQSNYSSIMDIVIYHADLMALASLTMGSNLLNSRLAYVFGAKNDATAQSFKKAMDETYSGSPFVVVDKKLLENEGNPTWEFFNQNLKQTFIANDILDVLRNIELSFDRAVGIPNMNEQKKERQVIDEVNANNFETECLIIKWYENLKMCFEKVNRMFGTKLAVELRKPEPAGGGENANDS